MKKNILQLSSITKSFSFNKKIINVLNNIDVIFEQGHSYAITGMSGSGKSTLLHIIATLDAPTSGTLLFNKKEMNTKNSNTHASFLNTSIGIMLQSAHLIKELSIVENVMLPALIAQKNSTEAKKTAEELLTHVGLQDKIYSDPGELSGGQQQRVALARALINKPAFLIADEPTGNLDISTSKAVINLLRECQQQWGMGLIISSHDLYVTQHMDYIFELKNGTLTQLPTTTEYAINKRHTYKNNSSGASHASE